MRSHARCGQGLIDPWRWSKAVPYKSLVELRAAYMPDAAWAVSGIPQADPEGMATPRF